MSFRYENTWNPFQSSDSSFDFYSDSNSGSLDRHRRLDAGMVLIVQHFEVFVFVAEDGVGLAPDVQRRIGEGLSRQLGLHLFEVIVVDVAVAAGPDEVAHLQAALLGQHMGQQRVAGDVEGHAQEGLPGRYRPIH